MIYKNEMTKTLIKFMNNLEGARSGAGSHPRGSLTSMSLKSYQL